MSNPIEQAFESAAMDLLALRHVDLDLPRLRHHTSQIEVTVGELCDACEQSGTDISELAHRAHRAVSELTRELEFADSDDRRTRDKLYMARDAVATLRDELESLIRCRR